MKINELLMSIHRKDFNIEKELHVKTYLPIEEKKAIAKAIIFECTEEINGVVKVDSVQQYLSYVKYMILRHTNLEYTHEDYDKLCSTEYQETSLLNAIINTCQSDANECNRILNLMLDDYLQENSIEFIIGKTLSGLTEVLSSKINEFDVNSIIPHDIDKTKMIKFLNDFIK